MKLEQVDSKKLLPLLNELTSAVEDLTVTGLTTASESTLKTLGVTFQESSRMGLLRLGATLRAVNDEVLRYTKNDPDFSRKRFAFFLNRSWLLSHAIRKAIQESNSEAFERLMFSPSTTAVDSISVVTVGAFKRVTRSFCAFDFILRATESSGTFKRGDKFIWSAVFPTKADSEIPAEGYLHLPQKQKFNAVVFLEPKIITITSANLSLDVTGVQRIALSETSTVTADKKFDQWQEFCTWDCAAAYDRLNKHETGPFDLEVELQEEIFLDDWHIGESWEMPDESTTAYQIITDTLEYQAVVPSGPAYQCLRDALDEYRKPKKERPTLYGLMHYERCKLVFQPLTAFHEAGPKHLLISGEKIDPKALLKAMKF